jgi:hypothetical protein
VDKYDEIARIAQEGRGTATEENHVRYYNSTQRDEDFARMPADFQKKFSKYKLTRKIIKERRLGSRGGMSSKHRMRMMRYKIKLGAGWTDALDDYHKRKRTEHLQMVGDVCNICQRQILKRRAMILCVDPQTETFREYVAVICKSCSMRWTPLQLANTKGIEEVRAHVEMFVDCEIKSWARYKLHSLPFERAQRLAKWLLSLTIAITSPRTNPLDGRKVRRRKRKLQGLCKQAAMSGLIGSQPVRT